MNKNEYIKSPLNYTGGKYKLLEQIIPLFPSKIETFVDLFGGGFNVGINVNCNNIIYNDKCLPVVDLLQSFYNTKTEIVDSLIKETINNYQLKIISKKDISEELLYKYKNNFYKLRKDYNNNPDWIKFYTLLTCAFNSQIRFNSKGEYNIPYGKRDYNKNLQLILYNFIETLHKKDIQFISNDYRNFSFTKEMFLYLDPPYLNSYASYNENNGWTEKDEKDLLIILDNFNKIGGKFALSNNLSYDNKLLENWMQKYNVHFLNHNYNNCSYHKLNREQNNIEILVTNY